MLQIVNFIKDSTGMTYSYFKMIFRWGRGVDFDKNEEMNRFGHYKIKGPRPLGARSPGASPGSARY